MATGSRRDYYEVLGVDRGADAAAIKQAYRALAIRYHPDRNPDDPGAEERFKEAGEAYAVLADARRRARYDRMGHAAFAGAGSGGFDPLDLGSMAEVLEGLLGEVFGGKRRRARHPRNIAYTLRIDFVEAVLGVEKTIEITRPRICRACGGSGAAAGSEPTRCPACQGKGAVRQQRGFFAASRPCPRCRGRGTLVEHPCEECRARGAVSKTEELLVRVPAGVEAGSVRTLRGAGEETPDGSGDLHVQIEIAPHPLFSRDGADILCEVPISFPQAVLGDQIEVPTIGGKVNMKLPAGTASGKVFRLRGKGVPVFGGAGKGDQLVTVVIEVPEKVSRGQRRLIEELASEMGVEALPRQKSFLEKLRMLFD